MKLYRAESVKKLSLSLHEEIQLESLRQSIIPPYLMLTPFIELPKKVTLIREDLLDEDGIHGCIYTLKPNQRGRATILIGFRDFQSNIITHQKTIPIYIA